MNTATPDVIFSQPVMSPSSQGRKWLTPKLIFIILGVIVAVELIFGLKALSSKAPISSPGRVIPKTQTVPLKGKIVLLSNKTQAKVGDIIPVIVEVTSPLPTEGTDVVVKFDSQVLQASGSAIIKGTIYPQYPLAKIDSGVVRISGITGVGEKGFSGKGVFATINFKALKVGVTNISLDFTQGSTTDSNIVSSSSPKDLLEEVQNLEVTIK